MLTFKRNNVMPLHMQVADWIKENIYAGAWKPGERIPSEYQLVDLLDMSRGTVKKAVETLSSQGLVLKIQGKGSYVADNNIPYSLGTNGRGFLSISESLSFNNIPFETQLVEAKFVIVEDDLAKKLHMVSGTKAFYLERVRLIHGHKAIFMENWVNPALCPGIENNDFSTQTLFSVIERLTNLKVKFVKGRYIARSIGDRRGKFLDVVEQTPVLYGEQLSHLENDVPVDLGRIWMRSDKYYFDLTLYR